MLREPFRAGRIAARVRPRGGRVRRRRARAGRRQRRVRARAPCSGAVQCRAVLRGAHCITLIASKNSGSTDAIQDTVGSVVARELHPCARGGLTEWGYRRMRSGGRGASLEAIRQPHREAVILGQSPGPGRARDAVARRRATRDGKEASASAVHAEPLARSVDRQTAACCGSTATDASLVSIRNVNVSRKYRCTTSSLWLR